MKNKREELITHLNQIVDTKKKLVKAQRYEQASEYSNKEKEILKEIELIKESESNKLKIKE